MNDLPASVIRHGRELDEQAPWYVQACEWLMLVKLAEIKRLLLVHASAMFIALGLAGYTTTPALSGVMLPLSIGAIWMGVFLSHRSRPHWILLGAVGVICVSALVAIPFAEQLAPTVLLALLTVALVPLVFTRGQYVWLWFTPVWLIHAGICFWQWFVLELPRVSGITGNANSASALLLIGCIYLLNGHSKAKWVVLPLLVAMTFTGSRWVAVVSGVTLLALFATRHISWKYIAGGVMVVVAMAVVVNWQAMQDTWLRPNTLEQHLTGRGMNSPDAETAKLSFIPQGFTDNGIHSVPWRMMHETGILSGVAWIVASIYGLKGKRDSRWWMLLSVVLISLMYYETWLGPLAGFWWLLVRRTENN